MRTEQRTWTTAREWSSSESALGKTAQLVLVFGARSLLQQPERREEIRAAYPQALTLGCSTAGEISSAQVADDSLVVTALCFDQVKVQGACVRINEAQDSPDVGRRLVAALAPQGLAHVFVLSDGLQVNGSELVQGLSEHLPPGVSVTGGLSGDGSDFKQTCVLWEGRAEPGLVVAVGFYGEALKVGSGSMGGWDAFGPERVITRSEGNVLYSLDDKGALDLYKRYLGEHAAGLPATGLHFPLAVRDPQTDTILIRTILAVDEAQGSMIFAGNMPQGHRARLMKSNVAGLVDGAVGAAKAGQSVLGSTKAQLALLVSCVGRRLVLKQRTEEELEGVRAVLGPDTVLTGFYSYGEISPLSPSTRCELHNETMTITLLSEG
jgi:hypothetical protein